MPTLKIIAERKEKLLDNLLSNHGKRIERALDSLERKVVANFNNKLVSGERVQARLLVELRKDLSEVFEETFKRAASKNISEYISVAEWFESNYENISKDLPTRWKSLVKVDKKILADLTKISFQGFEDIAQTFIDDIAGGVYESALVGTNKSQIVENVRGKINGVYKHSNDEEIRRLVKTAKEMKGTLSGDMAVEKLHSKYGADRLGNNLGRYARQMTHDSLMQFDAMYTKQKGDTLGLTHYLYYGDLINDSRQHCRTYAGQVLSNEQIDSAWSGSWSGKSGGDPHIVRGGYNCRHFFQPVNPEWTDLSFTGVEKSFEKKPIDPFGEFENLGEYEKDQLLFSFGLSNGINRVFTNISRKDLDVNYNSKRAHYSPYSNSIDMEKKGEILAGWKDSAKHGKWQSVYRHEMGHYIDYNLYTEILFRVRLGDKSLIKKLEKLDKKKLNAIGLKFKDGKLVKITGKGDQDIRGAFKKPQKLDKEKLKERWRIDDEKLEEKLKDNIWALSEGGDMALSGTASNYAYYSARKDIRYILDYKDRHIVYKAEVKKFSDKYYSHSLIIEEKKLKGALEEIDKLYAEVGISKDKIRKIAKNYKIDWNPLAEAEFLIGIKHGNPNAVKIFFKKIEAIGDSRINVHWDDFIGSFTRNKQVKVELSPTSKVKFRLGSGHEQDYYTNYIQFKDDLINGLDPSDWAYYRQLTESGMHEMYANYIDLVYHIDEDLAGISKELLEKFAPNVIKDFDDVTQVLM